MNLVLLHNADFLDETRVRLAGRRFRHIRDIHRANVGDRLSVGRIDGQIGTGTIRTLEKDCLELQVELNAEPPPPLRLTLVLALPRPKMLKRVLISAVSMGVKQLWLINSFRVEKSFWGSPLLAADKLSESLILGLEQARDTMLPVIHQRKLFKPFVEDELPALIEGTLPLVAHPHADTSCPASCLEPATLAIGPEGGFIPYEIDKLRECGFQPVSFGERILRVETAVPALLSRFMKD
jgi:16S rRNA (uracil1498-N3)-methyltransferase